MSEMNTAENPHIYIGDPRESDGLCFRCGKSYKEHFYFVQSHQERIEERERKLRYRQRKERQ